jgi:RNA polymerase sigma-70 factor, ECF subfamily
MDEKTVDNCIAGDRAAQNELFNSYYDPFSRLVYKMLGDREDREDILQTIFIQIFRSLPQYRGSGSLEAWLYRIAINVCREQIRRKYRKRRLQTVRGQEELDRLVDREATPSEALDRDEETRRIQEAINSLHFKKRVVLVLHDMEGRTQEEIAGIIGKPLGTVKSRLFHARNELQGLLKDVLERLN